MSTHTRIAPSQSGAGNQSGSGNSSSRAANASWLMTSACVLALLTAGCSSSTPPDPILGQWTLHSDDRVPLGLRAMSDDVYIHFFENGICIFAVPVPLTKKEITVKGTWKAGDQDNVRLAKFSVKDGEREVKIKMLDADTIELTPPTSIKVPVKFDRASTPLATKE